MDPWKFSQLLESTSCFAELITEDIIITKLTFFNGHFCDNNDSIYFPNLFTYNALEKQWA